MKKQLRLKGLVLMAFLAAACAQEQTDSTTERNKELVLAMNRQVWNEGNLAVIDEMFSPGFVQHFLPGGSDFKGIDALRKQVKAHRVAFPDWKEHINHIVAEDNLVAIQFESTGTNRGSWAGFPPTGRKIRINEFCILRIENGKITEMWLLPDIYNMRKQLGLEKAKQPMTKTAKGEFTVSLQPLTFEGANRGAQLGRMSIDKEISGDLVATTKGQMLSAMTATDGSAGYVAIEQVSGTLDGKTGTFVLQHSGLMDRGEQHLTVVVVPDSGTGELEGISGEFKITIEGGKHYYEFSYSLPGDTP